MFGKLGSSIQRATFVIDENAVVIKVFEKANPDTNASEILEFLRN
jgi:peroxiredoxin Q/BCP